MDLISSCEFLFWQKKFFYFLSKIRFVSFVLKLFLNIKGDELSNNFNRIMGSLWQGMTCEVNRACSERFACVVGVCRSNFLIYRL